MINFTRSLSAMILVFIAVGAFAAAPDKLSYQAYLTNADGSVVDGDRDITFAIYTVEFGGSPLWTATQFVPIENGLLSIELGGSTNPFPPGLFDTPLWIGLNVDGDGEMQPRRGLSSAAYAFSADTLQGQSPAAFDQSDHVSLTDNPHAVTATQTGAASTADIANLQSQLNDALSLITSLQISLVTTQSNLVTTQSDLVNADMMIAGLQSALAAESASRATADANHDASIATIEANSVLALDGILTHPDSDTALLTGVNLQIINGAGEPMSDGIPNGLGNLIVGYNGANSVIINSMCSFGEFATQIDCEANNGIWSNNHKTGSHNVVVGQGHNYSRTGGIITGRNNSITGEWSSVVGSVGHIARGTGATVTGGRFNLAAGNYSSISGGRIGETTGVGASITGGSFNEANGSYAAVLGGSNSIANGNESVVTSGFNNTSTGTGSSVSGGRNNVASGFASSISGGGGAQASEGNQTLADYSSVSGGQFNRVLVGSDYASISGGRSNLVQGGANYASISGGHDNSAQGFYSHVSGGRANLAFGNWTVVAGGNTNSAGDTGNPIDDPANRYSVVVGGQFNITHGQYSVVSGGSTRVTTGNHDWRAGLLFENQ